MSRVVRFVLEFRQSFELRERADAVFAQDSDIGRAPSGQFADPIERCRRTLDVLDELPNCCAGNDSKAHEVDNITPTGASKTQKAKPAQMGGLRTCRGLARFGDDGLAGQRP